jgi:hypothetical protein
MVRRVDAEPMSYLDDRILRPAIDHIESWLDGDADRTAACLHPSRRLRGRRHGRVLSSVYLDYLHVGRFGAEWLIVNILWQRRPGDG